MREQMVGPVAFRCCFGKELDTDRSGTGALGLRNNDIAKRRDLVRETGSVLGINSPERLGQRPAARDFSLNALSPHDELDRQAVVASGSVFISHRLSLL